MNAVIPSPPVGTGLFKLPAILQNYELAVGRLFSKLLSLPAEMKLSTNSVVAVLAATTHLASSQFVKAPQNLTTKTGYAGIDVRYKEVPAGICELDPDVKSYSGYADVADGQHIFWWFFESRNTPPDEAPLTVWINGGPGSSSMVCLELTEHLIYAD